ncbi:uncharacterized protein LOC125042947 [Penaeus chinensis]|uniref:uncharacterized protein LOC125042947 n=1 Tax=Penaeus chinensis TaxID=139456 RepID=UPI001FB70D0C|nr:uncharacterized protein LOC125042947 [Penaeus chinensis]
MNITEKLSPNLAQTRRENVFTWKPNNTVKPFKNKAIDARFPHQAPTLCPAPMFLRNHAHFHATSHAYLTKLIILVIITCLIKSANSSIIPNIVEYGKCVSLELPQDFSITRFSGVWYQVEEIPNTYVDVKQCIRTVYQWDGSVLQVLTEGLDEYGEQAEQETTISMVIPGNYSEDKPYLQIQSDKVPPVPYHIIDVDYDAFACAYSCFDFLSLKAEIYSILSRSPEASNATLSTCRDSFEALGLSLEKMVSVEQGEQCWYSEAGTNTSSTLSPLFLTEDEAEDAEEGFERGLEDALLSVAEEVAGAVERMEEEVFGTAEEYHKTTTMPTENKQPNKDVTMRRQKKKHRKKGGTRGKSDPVSSAVSSTPSFVISDGSRDSKSSSSTFPEGEPPSESGRHTGGAATSTTTPGFIAALQLVALCVRVVLR